MKKTGLLIVGAFLLAACDATPKKNRSILPVEHDEAVEHVDHHATHDGHEGHAEENQEVTESKDSANKTAEIPVAEKKDSAQ